MDDGPIGLLKDGDIIDIDINNRTLNAELSEEEFKQRSKDVELPKKEVKGWLDIYRKNVTSADKGAIMR
jgi:dihydroxy-acid dehydratase